MGVTKPKDVDAEKQKEEKKPVKRARVDHPKELKVIVRIANTDLDGEKPVLHALRMIKGLSHMMSKAVCKVSGINPSQKLGALDKQTIEKLEEIMKEPEKFGIPQFFVNRRRDIETGKDSHLIGLDLDVAKKFDVQRHIDLKTYRGWRHMLGQPVRGQKTRSSFREKGKIVGVMKKEIKLQMAKKPAEEEKKK